MLEPIWGEGGSAFFIFKVMKTVAMQLERTPIQCSRDRLQIDHHCTAKPRSPLEASSSHLAFSMHLLQWFFLFLFHLTWAQFVPSSTSCVTKPTNMWPVCLILFFFWPPPLVQSSLIWKALTSWLLGTHNKDACSHCPVMQPCAIQWIQSLTPPGLVKPIISSYQVRVLHNCSFNK